MALVAMAMAFATLLVVANIIAVKLVSIGGWVMPAGVLAYPFTFMLSDAIAELYGRRTATIIVWFGFAMSVAMVALVFVARIMPGAAFWEGQEAFDAVLGGVPRIVLGSLIAYIISQNHDVWTFHLLRRITGGRHLWMRNNVSTAISQGVDTIIFISIAFWGILPGSVILGMIGTQYVAKLVIAAVDTPLVYALVGLVRRYEPAGTGSMFYGLSAEPGASD